MNHPGDTEKKTTAAEAQREAMARLKASIQSNPRPRPTLIEPCTAPRYDEVYYAGIEMLNSN